MNARHFRVSHMLLAMSAVPLVAGGVRLAQLAAGEFDESTARFHQAPWPVTLHIMAATLFSVLGAFQLDPSWRAKAPGGHRSAGAVVLASGLVVAASGAYMAMTYAIPEALQGPFLLATRLAVSVGMFVSLLLALRGIVEGRYSAHGAWMLRAYALGLGAGTQVILLLPVELLLAGPVHGLPRDIIMAAAWGLNLVGSELFILRASIRRRCSWCSHAGYPPSVPSPT